MFLEIEVDRRYLFQYKRLSRRIFSFYTYSDLHYIGIIFSLLFSLIKQSLRNDYGE